jgi:hypothetical protein
MSVRDLAITGLPRTPLLGVSNNRSLRRAHIPPAARTLSTDMVLAGLYGMLFDRIWHHRTPAVSHHRIRAVISSPTRNAFAIMVRVGFTAPMEGKKLASVT